MFSNNAIHRRVGRRIESQFISGWLAGDSQMRTILTEIANWVDKNLADDPDQQGQPRSDLSARILAVPVSGHTGTRLCELYQDLPNDRQVHVVRLVIRGM